MVRVPRGPRTVTEGAAACIPRLPYPGRVVLGLRARRREMITRAAPRCQGRAEAEMSLGATFPEHGARHRARAPLPRQPVTQRRVVDRRRRARPPRLHGPRTHCGAPPQGVSVERGAGAGHLRRARCVGRGTSTRETVTSPSPERVPRRGAWTAWWCRQRGKGGPSCDGHSERSERRQHCSPSRPGEERRRQVRRAMRSTRQRAT